ncbi:MAG TPA: MBL fold metallo-hydrolase [Thermoplasmata archaeon]|nr:MBL fold metallo-hydrolase [Thermoplasmata archaeon]
MKIFQVGGRGYDSNIYLLKDAKENELSVLVDAGTGFDSRGVLDRIKQIENLRNIGAIFLTHEHFDHIGGVPKLIQAIEEKKGKMKVFAHGGLAQAVRTGNIPSARMFNGEAPQFEVEIELVDQQVIKFGREIFKVIYTPGHSGRSVSFYVESNRDLFCGDLIFSNGGLGRWDLYGGDRGALQKSIHKLAELDVKGIYPGHGPYLEANGKEWIALSLVNLRDYDLG